MRNSMSSALTSSHSSRSVKPLLVCFSHLRWSFVWQRPQHLLTRAARDYRVLFFEDPLLAPVASPRFEFSGGPGAVTVAVPLLPESLSLCEQIATRRRLIAELVDEMGPAVAVSWYYTPMALEFSDEIESDVCVYDCMDELSKFRGAPRELRRYEDRLFARADIVFTGGRSLYEIKRGRHPNVHCVPSSIDAAHFMQARSRPKADPPDQAEIGRPRIGFFGVIDERMDTGLLAAAADLAPDWNFIMIGPAVKVEPADLPRRPNIHWLGSKDYEQLPSYLSGWDLGFMPFAINEATQFISPTKTPEFLAAGLPVVSTPIVDVVRTYGKPGYIEIAGAADELVAKARMLLERPRAQWQSRVDRYLATTSWDATWEKINLEIERVRDRNGMAALEDPRVSLADAGEVSRV